MTATRNLAAIASLAPSQLGMLIQALGSTEPAVHVEQLSWPLHGPLREDAMEAAWAAVVDECETLRTGFLLREEGEPVQFVMRSAAVPLETLDLGAVDPRSQQPALDEFFSEQRERGFALDRPPLLRLGLVRCAEDLHQFVWTFHHLILDGWSVPLLAQRVFAVYEAKLRGEPPPAWESRPYRDFVGWLAEQHADEARRFWEERLGSLRLPTALGAEPPVGVANGHGHGVSETEIDAAELEALDRHRRCHRVTLATLLQGAWALLLAHYSSTDEVVFGATVSGRPPQLSGIESMVGLFINTIPVSIGVPQEGDVWTWLREQQQRRIEEQGFEHCSTGQIHDWLELPGSTPLFESILVFENYPTADGTALDNGVQVGLPSVRTDGSRTQFPVAIVVTPGDGLQVRLVNRRRNLDDDNADIMAAGLRELLSGLARRPDADLRELRSWVSRLPVPSYRGAGSNGGRRSLVAGSAPARAGRLGELRALWQELLETEAAPDPDANFFDIGGHSLLALRLTRQIRERFDVELALQQVFEAPTIRDLAALLDGGGAIAADVPALLTLLRPGRVERPLFLAPPGAGTPVCYSAAAAAIDTGQAVYGFQTPGLNDGEQPLRSVGEIAKCMVASMRQLQPQGPYRLAGWSFGAMVAWEAAALLQADGEQVETLILIDADVQDERATHNGLRRAVDETTALVRIAAQVGVPTSWERVRVLAQLVGVGLPESVLQIGGSELEAARRSYVSWYANTKASLGHEPRPFAGDLVLIRGVDSRPGFPDPLQARLSQLTGGRIRVRSVPGNHMTMMLDSSNAHEIGQAVSMQLATESMASPAAGSGQQRARRSKSAAATKRTAQTQSAAATKPTAAEAADREVRILALDGTEAVGGTGYVAAALLRELHDRMDDRHRDSFLNRTTIYAGTSAGSANALFLAMSERPDDAIAAAGEFWVESEKISSRQGVTVIGLARAVVGLGSLLSTKKLRGFYLSHFGMAKLGDLPHHVVIPTVCLDSPSSPGQWRPKVFTNLDPEGPDMETLVVDALMSSSSPPLLTPVYQTLAGDGPGYVDGGLWANNPAMAAIAQVASRRGDGSTDGISVLSVSNGDAKLGMQPKFRDGFGDLGYISWLLNPRMPGALLDLMLTVEEDATAFIAQSLLVERFWRLDPVLPGRMLSFDAKGIAHTVKQILELDETRTQLDETLAWLTDVNWSGVG